MFKRINSYVVVAVVAIVLTSVFQPLQNLSTLAQAGCQTFPQTGKTVCGRFLQYWQTHGGLAQQGYPISAEFTEVSDLNGQPYTVQYFERAVFEYHPENRPPNDVLLSQLGTFQFRRKYPDGQPSVPTSDEPIVLKGSGLMNTKPFQLSGGNYTFSWTATDSAFPQHDGCYHGGYLKAVDPSNSTSEVVGNITVPAGGTKNGTTEIYNLKAGQYYMAMNSLCDWTVTITKQR